MRKYIYLVLVLFSIAMSMAVVAVVATVDLSDPEVIGRLVMVARIDVGLNVVLVAILLVELLVMKLKK